MIEEATGPWTYRGQVKLFSATTGQQVAASAYLIAQKYDGTAESVAWSPDGKRLAVAAVPVRIWDSALQPLPLATTAASNCMDWSPDGKQLAAGSKDGTITILDAAAGTPLHVLQGHGFVDAVHWHPSMPRLASGGRDGIVPIWDTSTGQELCAFEAHTSIVRDLDWSPDGWRLATTSYDGSVQIWDASPADQFFKRHGDLRNKVWKLVGDAVAGQGKRAMSEDFQEALDLLQRLRALHPEEKDLQWEIRHVEWLRGWLRATQFARAGRTDEALAVFKQLAAESPDLPDYRLQLPGVLLDAGRETHAFEMLEKAVAEFPQRPEYHEELAYLYERRAIQLCLGDKLPDAVSILRKLAQEFPERPGHRSQIVRNVMAQLPQEKAIEVFRNLMQEFPDAPEYRQALARCLQQAGRHQEAEALLKSGPVTAPKNEER
jgi:tetratricopeptide (TPR) repeat protein